MRGAVPPLPQYAIMTWFSVEAQGQLHTYTCHWDRHICLVKGKGKVFPMLF